MTAGEAKQSGTILVQYQFGAEVKLSARLLSGVCASFRSVLGTFYWSVCVPAKMGVENNGLMLFSAQEPGGGGRYWHRRFPIWKATMFSLVGRVWPYTITQHPHPITLPMNSSRLPSHLHTAFDITALRRG
jgi:hypothetical protein